MNISLLTIAATVGIVLSQLPELNTNDTSPKIDLTIVANQPLVSVITASYNRDRYLEYAINSVIEQTYTNWELIIVDDGSHKQEAIDVLLKYPQIDSRVRTFFLNSNYGEPTVARNYAIH